MKTKDKISSVVSWLIIVDLSELTFRTKWMCVTLVEVASAAGKLVPTDIYCKKAWKSCYRLRSPKARRVTAEHLENVTADCVNHTVSRVNCVMRGRRGKNKELVILSFLNTGMIFWEVYRLSHRHLSNNPTVEWYFFPFHFFRWLDLRIAPLIIQK